MRLNLKATLRATTPWLGIAAIAITGCGGTVTPAVDAATPDTSVPMDSGPPDTGTDAGPLPDTGPLPDVGPVDSGLRDCGAEGSRPVVAVSGEITADTVWTCDNIYELQPSATFGPVYVVGNHTLTIEPGTLVRGQARETAMRRCQAGDRMGMVCTTEDDNATTGCPGALGTDCRISPTEEGTALVISRGSRLIANGTATAPIVFTSSRYGTSTAPAPGNWGGIVLLGAAPTNNDPSDGAQIEGLPPAEGRGLFGGTDATHDCGSLRYVRIEYAGYVFGRNNELNGLTVGGCGSSTELEYIQIHRGLDDGIEFFGGTVDVRHAVVTGTGDDSLDYDLGWTGHVQFYIAQQRNVAGEERCIEGDNHPSAFSRTPLTQPTIYNFSCIGPSDRAGVDRMALSHDGIIIRRGASAILRNSIFAYAADKGIQIDDTDTGTADTASDLYAAGTTLIDHNIVWRSGPDGMSRYFDIDASTTPAMARDVLEAMALAANRVIDPGLTAAAIDDAAPNFAPAAGSASSTDAAALPATPAGFWTPAAYIGAVEPGATGAGLWYEGWTRFTP